MVQLEYIETKIQFNLYIIGVDTIRYFVFLFTSNYLNELFLYIGTLIGKIGFMTSKCFFIQLESTIYSRHTRD